jgi:hypothetical protein
MDVLRCSSRDCSLPCLQAIRFLVATDQEAAKGGLSRFSAPGSLELEKRVADTLLGVINKELAAVGE